MLQFFKYMKQTSDERVLFAQERREDARRRGRLEGRRMTHEQRARAFLGVDGRVMLGPGAQAEVLRLAEQFREVEREARVYTCPVCRKDCTQLRVILSAGDALRSYTRASQGVVIDSTVKGLLRAWDAATKGIER